MPTTHSGFMIQSGHGATGNFELVVPSRYGGLVHAWRDNDAPGFPWTGPTPFGSGDVTGVALIESGPGGPGGPGSGTLEAVVVEGHRLGHYQRSAQFPFPWLGPLYVASGVTGNPALVQSRFGGAGNFELVVPLEEGGLAHFWRDNDDPDLPWIGPGVFATDLGVVDAVALLHSTLGQPGTLEVVARAGDRLFHLWRDSGPLFQWTAPVPFFAGASGVPALVQSDFGALGNFELVTPLLAGGLAHLWCDTADPARPWSPPAGFGQGQVSAVSLLQSDLGAAGAGTLELAARVAGAAGDQAGAETVHYYRPATPAPAWQGPGEPICPEPASDPPLEGEWRVPFGSGVVGVHAALLHTGKVLFFSYEEHGGQEHGDSSVLDPATGQVSTTHVVKNLFCSGQGLLPDGRLLVAGGATTAVQALHAFTPNAETGTWQDLGDLSGGRWYPTISPLPDGRALIISGTAGGGGPRVDPHACALIATTPLNDTYECFDPAAGAPGAGGALQAPRPAPVVAAADPYALFPFVFVLPDNRLLVHAGTLTRFLDLASETWVGPELAAVSPTARTYPSTGTAVLLPLLPGADPPHRARVLLIGGAGVACPTPAAPDTPGSAACELLDLGAPAPAWQPAAPLSGPRVMPDAVLLPDGTVLVVNGSSTGVADNGINPVFSAERYDPASDAWTSLAPMRVPRLYHSTALLLPDGRVLTAGKDEEFNPPPFNYPEYRVEVFSPPYLFKGPRPVIAGAPAQLAYGGAFAVQTPDAAAVAGACLIRPGTATHSFNPDQRYVGLALTGAGAGSVTLQAPPDAAVAPPGHYMLFLLSASGVPSVAVFVRVG